VVGKENKVFPPLAIYFIINQFLREVMKMAKKKGIRFLSSKDKKDTQI